MTTIINASATNGLQQTADGSGVLKVQSNGVTTNALAWVNFNGTTAAIRASYNVSSVTRTSTGTYSIAFTNLTADANYSVTCGGYTGNPCTLNSPPTTSGFNLLSYYNGAAVDVAYVTATVHGN